MACFERQQLWFCESQNMNREGSSMSPAVLHLSPGGERTPRCVPKKKRTRIYSDEWPGSAVWQNTSPSAFIWLPSARHQPPKPGVTGTQQWNHYGGMMHIKCFQEEDVFMSKINMIRQFVCSKYIYFGTLTATFQYFRKIHNVCVCFTLKLFLLWLLCLAM